MMNVFLWVVPIAGKKKEPRLRKWDWKIWKKSKCKCMSFISIST